ERAVRALPAGPQRAQAFLHLGLARAYLQKYDAARRAFASAVTDDPTVHIDADRVPPEVRDAFAAARASVTGTLVVEGGPAGARLEVDGKDVAPLPATQTLPAGEHEVRVLDAEGKPVHSG